MKTRVGMRFVQYLCCWYQFFYLSKNSAQNPWGIWPFSHPRTKVTRNLQPWARRGSKPRRSSAGLRRAREEPALGCPWPQNPSAWRCFTNTRRCCGGSRRSPAQRRTLQIRGANTPVPSCSPFCWAVSQGLRGTDKIGFCCPSQRTEWQGMCMPKLTAVAEAGEKLPAYSQSNFRT